MNFNYLILTINGLECKSILNNEICKNILIFVSTISTAFYVYYLYYLILYLFKSIYKNMKNDVDYKNKILQLKQDKNAIIMAHYYTTHCDSLGTSQDIAISLIRESSYMGTFIMP